jgi:CDGSH-type Zn-finger protein
MTSPAIAQKAPFAVEVEAGQTYWSCACDRSKRQPFCDGSHKGGPFIPREFVAQEKATVWFCGCKHTRDAPVCDGSHKSL